VRAGSNHESQPNPFRGAVGYDTPPTLTVLPAGLPTLVSVRRYRRHSAVDCSLGKAAEQSGVPACGMRSSPEF
jgi:hypothetical protein